MTQRQKVRTFIESNLLVSEDESEFTDSDNIFQLGYVNSLFAMRLLNYIENEFQIKIDNEEMELKNFSSVDNILCLITSKQQSSFEVR